MGTESSVYIQVYYVNSNLYPQNLHQYQMINAKFV